MGRVHWTGSHQQQHGAYLPHAPHLLVLLLIIPLLERPTMFPRAISTSQLSRYLIVASKFILNNTLATYLRTHSLLNILDLIMLSPFLCLQVSLNPPVSALHATDEKENIEMIWCQQPVPKFRGIFHFLSRIISNSNPLINSQFRQKKNVPLLYNSPTPN